jgi:hypothetical protein
MNPKNSHPNKKQIIDYQSFVKKKYCHLSRLGACFHFLTKKNYKNYPYIPIKNTNLPKILTNLYNGLV